VLRFRSDQDETSYKLTIFAHNTVSGKVTQIVNVFQSNDFFDSYGYMHRAQVKQKIIDHFAS
jgi:hypothetical protein